MNCEKRIFSYRQTHFFGAIALLLSIVFPLILFPTEGAEWIAVAKTFMTDKLGFLYLALGLAAFIFMIYVVFSDMGQIKLGDPDEKPEFTTASMGGLSTLQTAAIVGGLPLLGISIMLMVSAVRATTLDIRHQEDYVEPTINIEELPEFDPWSPEGIAMARFECARDAAQEAAEDERDALAELIKLRKRIRAFALEHSDDNDFADHHLPQEMQEELQNLLDNVVKAKERKLELSETAQQSRAEFNQIVAQITAYAV